MHKRHGYVDHTRRYLRLQTGGRDACSDDATKVLFIHSITDKNKPFRVEVKS
jgi:hypothetical protein